MRKIKLKPIKQLKPPKNAQIICVQSEFACFSILQRIYERELFSDLWNKIIAAVRGMPYDKEKSL